MLVFIVSTEGYGCNTLAYGVIWLLNNRANFVLVKYLHRTAQERVKKSERFKKLYHA